MPPSSPSEAVQQTNDRAPPPLPDPVLVQQARAGAQQSTTLSTGATTKPQPLSVTQSSTPGRNQSVSFRPQTPGASPRSTLQPISARQQIPSLLAKFPQSPQQSSYALAKARTALPRHIDFAEPAKQPDKASAQVSFWLTFHAEFGQRLRVVGSHRNLGMHSYMSANIMPCQSKSVACVEPVAMSLHYWSCRKQRLDL